MLLLAATLWMGLAVFSSSHGAAPASPRLASMQIDIWPEFDRPAVLVILKGEIAQGVSQRTLSLRIPATSGGPLAVAAASTPGGDLLNLQYERSDSKNFITLRFKVPQRFFQVEFYDPIPTDAPDRSYTYTWPGDMTVERLSVNFQEPAAASNVSMTPSPGATTSGPHGLLYRTAAVGRLEEGKQLPIEIRYTKSDSRTSLQILGVNAGGAPEAAVRSSEAPAANDVPIWLLVLTFAAVLAVAATVALLWWLWRRRATEMRGSSSAFCARCGGEIDVGDRFCSACGAPVRSGRPVGHAPERR